jgi:hypothetical protein
MSAYPPNMAARRRAETEVMLPPGPKVAFAGGYECNDHTAIWAALDRVQAKHPGMVLLHGGSPKGAPNASPPAGRMPVKCRRSPSGRTSPGTRTPPPFKRNDHLLAVLTLGVAVFPGSGLSDNLADKAKTLGIPLLDLRPKWTGA